MPPANSRPSFILYPDRIHWQRISDARVGALLKMAVQSLMELNEQIQEIEDRRAAIRSEIVAHWQTANVQTMRLLNARYRDCGKELSGRHYWRITIERQIAEVAAERRRIFGAKP